MWLIPDNNVCFSSVQFSCSVVSDSLWPYEPQDTRPPCPSPTPRVHPNPCPLSWWCHPTISSSVTPFSSCPQSFSGSGSFQMSQLFASGGQSNGVSALTSVLPMNIQDWSPLGWTGCISLQYKGINLNHKNKTKQKQCHSSSFSNGFIPGSWHKAICDFYLPSPSFRSNLKWTHKKTKLMNSKF